MEDAVRSLLQYKSRVESLKQEKATLSSALEASSAHYHHQVAALTEENERLRNQLSLAIEDQGIDQERRLDDVAQQLVRALLSQKTVRDELVCARARVRELENQNKALSSILIRQLRPAPRPSPATPHTPITPHTPRDVQVQLLDVGSCGSLVSFRDSPPPTASFGLPHALSHDDKRRHQILNEIWTELKGMEVTPANLARALSAVDPALWAPPTRPVTLSLNMAQGNMEAVRENLEDKIILEEENGEAGDAGAESPESGAKDEGYSTMSSDVQADASRQSDHPVDRVLPDLNEASDETDNQTIVSINPREHRNGRIVDQEHIYLPIGVAFAGVRGSYPPSRPVVPFQHVIRSFSDSHLCLKLLTGPACTTSGLESPTPSSGVLVLDLKPIPERPLRRPAIESLASSERFSWGSTVDDRADGSQYDAEYVQHWLELDDARSALQQRHRDIVELEYDKGELEDWSLSFSCEDVGDRQSPFAEIVTPGQISLSTLPSIREVDALQLDEDVGDCLWNDCGFANVEIDECRTDELDASMKPWERSGGHSPGGSWSSASDVQEKRCSTALSEEGDCANVDFTRDFYRLVKYESTKSLASNSSRGIATQDFNQIIQEEPVIVTHEREHALQSVLNFIAEQQKYCREREESDSLSSRPVSEIHELPPPYAVGDFDDDSVGPRSEISDDRIRPDSFASFSENESLSSDKYKSKYSESVDGIKISAAFIEHEEPYAECQGFFNNLTKLNNDSDRDVANLIRIKNQINKSIDNVILKEEPRLLSPEEDRRHQDCKSMLDVRVKEISDTPLVKSSSFPYTDSSASFVEEVLNVCKKSSNALVTVPEEEETSSPDVSSPQMTESITTSTSTADTVILSNNDVVVRRVKSEKSRIPTFTGNKRSPLSPNKNRSKIPVLGKTRPSATQSVTSPDPIIVRQEDTLSFHETATSKDVIEELNRMIRQSEGPVATSDLKSELEVDAHKHDTALWAATGWVHVEKDIDFSDPKARANLLDVMLASSDSSPSSCSSSPAEPQLPYSRLHRLHRSRRQKTAAALRMRGLAVLRLQQKRRPSILGRDGFFVRFGDRERAAVACFDFLNELPASLSPEAT